MQTSKKTPVAPNPACGICKRPIDDSVRLCPTCGGDCGYPNVRCAEREQDDLIGRSNDAKSRAKTRGCGKQLASLISNIQSDSHVVVAFGSVQARAFLQDPLQLYQNYENLVGGGSRLPSGARDHAHRTIVTGMLFGPFADQIRYGVLSLDGRGPMSYGDVFIRLRNIAIEHRVSFLENNSYHFVDKFKVTPSNPPPSGYRSTWNARAMLAAAKLENRITSANTSVHWPRLLLEAESKDRSKDEFIEAHIYGSFNSDAFESWSFSPKANWSREVKSDIAVIKQLIRKASTGK